MAPEGVTKAAAFDLAPAYPSGLFQVNPGVDVLHAFSKAQCILGFIKTRLTEAVQDEMSAEEAYVQCILVEMVGALYKSAGAEF